jgi:hypothetical protein
MHAEIEGVCHDDYNTLTSALEASNAPGEDNCLVKTLFFPEGSWLGWSWGLTSFCISSSELFGKAEGLETERDG